MNENENAGKNVSPVASETGPERDNENNRLHSGALRSSLTIELHTRHAIQLWQGREGHEKRKGEKGGRKKGRKWRIIGMPFFLHLVTVMSDATRRDDPFADERMLKLETLFTEGDTLVGSMIRELDTVLHDLPRRISLSSVSSVSPVNIGVFSSTPVGYRCVWLLVGFDQLAMLASQAWHYGLISHTQREKYLNGASAAVRRVFGIALGYKRTGVTRMDVLKNTPLAQEAERVMGPVSEDVLWGRKRSSWSPPLGRTRTEAMSRSSGDEKTTEEPVITAGAGDIPVQNATEQVPGSDDSSEFREVQSQTQTQTQTEESPEPDDGRRELTDEVDIDIDDLSVLLPPSADEPE
ncbi:TIGR03761 family integrating conjugative element protein [Salmonella enterica]|nr:TIGR03761 family integrating conjugative element protein [Salmonella enterica]ELW8656243.1 TIGR03761 family integrating conjugative element protein [Salmonella enterica]